VAQPKLRYHLDDWFIHITQGGSGWCDPILKQHPQVSVTLGSNDAGYRMLKFERFEGPRVQGPVALKAAIPLGMFEGMGVVAARPARIDRRVSSIQSFA
jgi:hypothetical protein